MPGYRRGVRRRTEFGVGLFIEEGAYTTVTAAVSILMVLALVFSAASAGWALSRAGDTQVAADATALAGANVVASYHTAATVVDATVLSMGLTGFALAGAGLAATLIPGVNAAAGEMVDAGIRMVEKRNELARSASEGLQKLEGSLPYLSAANGMRACSAQSSDQVAFTGVAIAVPRESASEFPALTGEGIATEGLEQAAGELDDVADELARASEEAAHAKEAAWVADCGREGMSMQERAARLSGLSAAENPDYESSLTWEPRVGLERARAYYRWRRDHDESADGSVEARADAAARHAFYAFAARELEAARIEEADGRLASTVPLLPRNTDEVRKTSLFTDATWPTTWESAGRTLHFSTECPGATGPAAAAASMADMESTDVRRCRVCAFDVTDLGAAPAASTSIDNGFEYHLREYTLALEEYVEARNAEMEVEGHARGAAEGAGDAFEDALSALAGRRPRIAPPGRYGCVAVVGTGPMSSPDELDSSFAEGAELSRRAAISAAVLAPDAATRENNVLSTFFAGLEERSGAGGIVGVLGSVMDLWGDLLMAYGDVGDGLSALMDELLGGLNAFGMGPVAQWMGERVGGVVRGLGFGAVDLSLRKPVLTNSANVIARSGMTQLGDVQALLRSLPVGSTDPVAWLQAIEYRVGEYIDQKTFTIARIPLPGGGSIPLTVRLRELLGKGP